MSDVTGVTLLTQALEAFREEYSDLADTWRQLEAKAQGTVAVAGIFLGAAYAFVRDLHTSTTSAFLRVGLAVGVIVFVFSVALAVAALFIRQVPAPPVGDTLEELANDLLRLPSSERIDRMPDFVRDQIGLWRDANRELRNHTGRKAHQVRWAQVFLLVGLGLIALETILLLAGVS